MNATIIGSGAWGTTLAKVLADNGHEVIIWSHDQKICDAINTDHVNHDLLPEIILPSSITSSTDLKYCCGDKELIVIVVASQYFAGVAKKISNYISEGTYLLSATKGLDESGKKRMSQLLVEALPDKHHEKIAVLSGPNISREIALGKPSTTVISSSHADTAAQIQGYFNNAKLRVYTNHDVVGTEFGGTLKNIIAIAAGIVDGLELGDNAKSALMVRGLNEMAQFAVHFGADKGTLYGLAGMGDLITTCSSTISRNHFVGENLGKGKTLSEILSSMTAVAEGVGATRTVMEMAKSEGLEMPVTREVYEVLFKDKDVEAAINELMSRRVKSEF